MICLAALLSQNQEGRAAEKFLKKRKNMLDILRMLC